MFTLSFLTGTIITVYIYFDLTWFTLILGQAKATAYNDPPVIVVELVSLGVHWWFLDVDGWYIPMSNRLGWCSLDMSIESALNSVDARCLHYWLSTFYFRDTTYFMTYVPLQLVLAVWLPYSINLLTLKDQFETYYTIITIIISRYIIQWNSNIIDYMYMYMYISFILYNVW